MILVTPWIHGSTSDIGKLIIIRSSFLSGSEVRGKSDSVYLNFWPFYSQWLFCVTQSLMEMEVNRCFSICAIKLPLTTDPVKWQIKFEFLLEIYFKNGRNLITIDTKMMELRALIILTSIRNFVKIETFDGVIKFVLSINSSIKVVKIKDLIFFLKIAFSCL